MCRLTDSARAVRDAARELEKACAKLCQDDVGTALHSVYDDALNEPTLDVLRKLVDRLQ